MANLRIRELDTVTVGTGGTAADAVYLVVDPSSGGTGKVSLESAVAGTNIIANAESALGAPLISQGNSGMARDRAYVINNLLAAGTTVFGNIWYQGYDGRNRPGGGEAEINISKNKGSSTVFVMPRGNTSNERGAKTHGIVSGTPGNGYAYSQQLAANHRDKMFIHTIKIGRSSSTLMNLWFHTNGFYISSNASVRWQIMYWPSS